MKKIYTRRDRAIREAFQIYDSAKIQSAKEKREDGNPPQRNASGTGEEYLDAFEENKAEDRIYRLIEKLPIQNPRNKARKIWISCVAAVLFCVLAGCTVRYIKEKPTRITVALQEVYSASGARMREGETNPLVTRDGLLYQCHYLTKEEQETLKKKGVTYQKAEENALGEFSQELQVYYISGRESRQFILVEDSDGQVSLGKFIAYKYWQGTLAADDEVESGDVTANGEGGSDAGNVDDEGQIKRYGTGDILEQVMGIYSPEDIRSVIFERSRAVSKNNPEKMVAMWTKKADREWIYHFLSKNHKIWNPSPVGDETQEEINQIKEEGMPITFEKKLYQWQSQVLEEIPEQAFYLEIENKLHETFLLGLVLEQEQVELWMEPLEEWSSQGTESGEAAVCFSENVDRELAQVDKRNGVICLSREDQRSLSEVMWKALEE